MPDNITPFPVRAVMRLKGSTAATPAPAGSVLARERPPSQVPTADRLRAKDVAQLEGCSISTAGDLLRSGKLGTIHGRNRRNRWIDRRAYQNWLDQTT